MSAPRQPVTPHEASTIARLSEVISKAETFYCHGIIKETGVTRPLLLYVGGENDVPPIAQSVPLLNPSSEVLDRLHADFRPSHFGQGRETVMDESYRLARELLGDNFNLNFDPLSPRIGVVASVAAFCKTGVDVVLYKINSYTTGKPPHTYKLVAYVAGGHFKAHKDTPKATNHVGTLLLGLPAPYSGGELLLRKGDETITLDWSTEGRQGGTEFLWAFFYSDVEHEIAPVRSGHRLTIAYDVYSTDEVRYATPADKQAVDIKDSVIYRALKAMVDDRDFLPQGGRLAFGLSYEYPAVEMEKARVFNAILKGNDNVLWHALTALGFDVEVKAAYKLEEYKDDDDASDEDMVEGQDSDQDEVDSAEEQDDSADQPVPARQRNVKPGRLVIDQFGTITEPDQWTRYVLMTAKSFAGIREDYCEGEYGWPFKQLLQRSVKAEIEEDLIWVTKPSKFAKNGNFASYGNEPSTNCSYVAGALIVTLSR